MTREGEACVCPNRELGCAFSAERQGTRGKFTPVESDWVNLLGDKEKAEVLVVEFAGGVQVLHEKPYLVPVCDGSISLAVAVSEPLTESALVTSSWDLNSSWM